MSHLNKIKCLIDVIIEISYIDDDLISQKSTDLGKIWVFPISFKNRKHRVHPCFKTIF